MLGLATACLLSVLIVLEYYPALDEKKTKSSQCGPLVLGVATSIQNKQTKEQTRDANSTKLVQQQQQKQRTSAISSKSEKCHGNRKEFPAADQVNHQNDNSF